MVYTSQPNADAQQTVDAFQALHPAVEVEWIHDGTTKVMARLRAEFAAGAPQPDVLLIADMVTMEGLKSEGRLMAHPGADVSAFDPAIMDPDKTYFSTKLITTGIIYNTAASMIPTSYLDLLKPEAKGKIAHAIAHAIRRGSDPYGDPDGRSRSWLGLLPGPCRAGHQPGGRQWRNLQSRRRWRETVWFRGGFPANP